MFDIGMCPEVGVTIELSTAKVSSQYIEHHSLSHMNDIALDAIPHFCGVIYSVRKYLVHPLASKDLGS